MSERRWPRRPAPRSTIAVCALLAGGLSLTACGAGSADAAPEPGPRLDLVLAESVGVPDSWLVRELLPLTGGGAALFLEHPGRLVRLPDTTGSIRLPNRTLVGMRESEERALEVVDGRFKHLLRLDVEGSVERIGALDIAEPIWDASWHGARWWIIAGDSAAAPRLVQATSDGTIVETSVAASELMASQTRAGQVGGRPALAEIASPFRVLVLERGAWRELHLGPPTAELPHAAVALDLVPLDDLAVQTLVDQTSMRRVVRLLSADATPALVREVELGAPVALVGADPAGRLVALGPAGGREVLWYSWRWRGSSAPSRD